MNYKPLVLFFILSALSGCTNVNKPDVNNSLKAHVSDGTLKTFQCVRNLLKEDKISPRIFLVDGLVDGTVPNTTFNGTLSDSGNIQLKSALVELVPNNAGVTSDIVPSIFRVNRGSKTGINEYGSSNPTEVTKYIQDSSKFVFSGRQPRVFLIKGAFTRFDENPSSQSSQGFSGGSDGTDGDGEFSFGKANRKQGVALTVNIVEPASNIILTTQSFLASVENNQRELKIRLGPGEGALGYSQSFQESLTPHEVQQHLIDVAAIWIINKTYGSANIRQCLAPQVKQAITDII